MEKRKPHFSKKTFEGSLGNFVTDAMLQRAKTSYNKTINELFANSSRLRVFGILKDVYKTRKDLGRIKCNYNKQGENEEENVL
ncbi:MAG TPA: hypothetical protein VF623_11590 [Segetibacter sp.]